jgi:uncharacterized protein YggT (Ycf19 family)
VIPVRGCGVGVVGSCRTGLTAGRLSHAFIIKISRPYLSLFDRFNLSFGPIDFTIIVAILVLNFASQGLAKLVLRIFFGF